jgi:hypothetical protein
VKRSVSRMPYAASGGATGIQEEEEEEEEEDVLFE